MHPAIFAAFDRICEDEHAGGDVLEVGATPSADTLLRLPALGNVQRRIGISLDPAFRDETIEILCGTANRMLQFGNASFDTVLCNSMLEHDHSFWLTLSEIRRVLKPGGLFVVGVPGFGAMKTIPFWRGFARLSRIPVAGRPLRSVAEWIGAAAPTLGIHRYPEDYYRFSEAAVCEVFLAGMTDTSVTTLLMPPRFIGWGRAATE